MFCCTLLYFRANPFGSVKNNPGGVCLVTALLLCVGVKSSRGTNNHRRTDRKSLCLKDEACVRKNKCDFDVV